MCRRDSSALFMGEYRCAPFGVEGCGGGFLYLIVNYYSVVKWVFFFHFQFPCFLLACFQRGGGYLPCAHTAHRALLLRLVYPEWVGWYSLPKCPPEESKPLSAKPVQTSLYLALSSTSQGENT